MSKTGQPADDGWVSRWERHQAWTATFGNRSDLPWPYSSTPIDHVVGKPPAVRTRLRNLFAEVIDAKAGAFLLVASLIAIIAHALVIATALTSRLPLPDLALLVGGGVLYASITMVPATRARLAGSIALTAATLHTIAAIHLSTMLG